MVCLNQYATKEYYLDTFKGTSVPENEIEKYLQLAKDKIDEVTFNRIVKIGFDKLTDFQKECIRKAVCYQADYFYAKGINSLSGVSSFSVLDVSISVDKAHESEAQKNDTDEIAYMNLKKSDLMRKSHYGFTR